jgi:hypothetical protein
VLIYAGWASLGAACAIGMANRSAGAAGAAAAITVGGSVALWLFVCHQEKRMAELHGSSQRVP